MNHVTVSKSVITTFDLNKMSNKYNHFNPELVHPMHHEIEIIDLKGKAHKIKLGQIATMIIQANAYPNIGKAIDQLFVGIPEDVSDICSRT